MRKVIGIDLGGTSINGGLVNEKGEILKQINKATGAKDGRKLVIQRIKELVEELAEGQAVDGLAIGSPGFIDVEKGRVLSIGGNIDGWAYTNLKEELLEEFPDLPIFIGNDANLAAIGEEWMGVAKGFESFIMLTLGTGVGGGIYSKEGGIWKGRNYEGGELGHAILYPNGRQCICGQKGCVEEYISGNALEKNYKTLTGKNLKAKDIFIKSKIDEECRQVVDIFINDLGNFLITLKNIFDPEGIVIGGGIINSRKFWWDETIEFYRENSNSIGLKILPAKLLNNAGIIGAAKLALDKI